MNGKVDKPYGAAIRNLRRDLRRQRRIAGNFVLKENDTAPLPETREEKFTIYIVRA